MSRFTFFLVIVILALLGYLAVNSLKSSYKILPIQAAKKVDQVPFSDWHKFESKEDKFIVKLPVVPQHATQTIVDPKTKQSRVYDMYVAQKEDGTIFMVSLIKFPNALGEMDESLQKTIINDMVASNPQNQLKNMQVNTFLNHQALDFSIENDALTIFGKTFINNNVLYLLTTIFNNDTLDARDFEYFVNSFTLDDGVNDTVNFSNE